MRNNCGYEAWRLELPVRAYNQGPFYSDTGIGVMLNRNIVALESMETAGGIGMASSAAADAAGTQYTARPGPAIRSSESPCPCVVGKEPSSPDVRVCGAHNKPELPHIFLSYFPG